MYKKLTAGVIALALTFGTFSAPFGENNIFENNISAQAVTQKTSSKKLSQQKIRKITAIAGGFRVSYKKNSSASGYQIKVSSNKKFKGGKVVTVRSKKTVVKNVKGLKSGKKYYVKVRSYKKSGKKTYYGKWSKIRSVITKKKHFVVEQPDVRSTFNAQCTTKRTVTLRTAPRLNAPVITKIPKNTKLLEYGYNDFKFVNDDMVYKYDRNQWIYTKYKGHYGWVVTQKYVGYKDTYDTYAEFAGKGGKPAIYLYPTKKTDVSVKVNLKTANLATTFPKYKNGWNVTAFPDGKIKNKADGEIYDYLFWESRNDHTHYDLSKGFVVKGSDSEKFLRKKLTYLGLNREERNEFMAYWLPKLEKNKYNLITFQNKEYTENNVLTISPEPDSILRVFMVYKPLNKNISVPEQKLSGFKRKGFTVVEWGGEEFE